MKIAVIVSTYPPYKGGMGNSAHELARLLAREHPTLTLTLSQGEREQTGEEWLEGVKVIRMKPLFSFGFKNGGFVPRLYRELKKSVAGNFPSSQEGAGVVLHYPFYGGAEIVWLFKLLNPRVKLIIHFHMDTPALSGFAKLLSIPSLLIRKSLFKRADKVISASLDYVAHSDIRSYFKKWPGKFVEIPFGVQLDKFHVYPHDIGELKALRKRYGIGDKDRVIMFLGGLDEAHKFKGIDILLRAVSSFQFPVSSFKCLICGDGNMRVEYEQQAEDLGIQQNVIFAGRVPDDELVMHYNLADIFVLPSTDTSEAFGMVLLEAMACGVPVMASDLPGVRSVFANGVQGYTVAPGSARNLRVKLEEFLKYPQRRLKMGRAARELVEERYDIKKIEERLREIF